MKQIIHKKTVWVGVTVLILCAALLIAFIGFRRKESKSRLLADGEIASAQEITSEKLENSKWLCTLGDHMVVYSSALGQYKARRFSCVSKNGEITDAPYTLDKFERVSELCADPEGNLLLTSSLAGDNYVKLYDSEGSCLFQVNLTEKIGNGRVDSVRRDASGFLYIIARDENEALLYVLDSQGNIQSKFPLLFTVGYLRNLGNGDVACVYMEEDAQNGGVQFAVQVYADAQKAEKYILPVRSLPDLTAVQDGGAFDLYYYDSNYRLYGYDLKKKQSTEIVNLFEAGIPGSEIDHYGVLDDTTVYVVTNRYNKEEIRTGNALYRVTAGRSNENREELVLGILYVGGRISEAVEAFNKENQDYYVTFKDYSEFQEPRKQAVLDMMSGNAPDLLCTNGFHTAQLTGQKLLEDLYPYLSDSGLEKELDANILKLLSDKEKHDGAPENPLYELCLSYRIDAVITGKNCLEDGKRWPDTLTGQAGKNGQFLAGMSESELLDQLVANNFDRLVDASNKRCYFDSDEFAALLECAKELADDRLKYMDSYGVLEGALDGIESGKALGADFCSLEGIFNYQILSGFYSEGVSVVPYPLTQTEGVGFTAGDSYGICSASGHKEGAWEFLKFQLEEEWQENYAGDDEVPMNKKALNRYIERVTAVDGYMDENQQFIEPVDRELSLTDMTIKLRPVSESEEELFRELLLSVGHQSRQDEMISEIVQDEAKAYFDGTRTGRDVIGRIQNRVSMYLQE